MVPGKTSAANAAQSPIMNLDDTQKQTVRAWIEDGQKLAEIQKRLGSQFGLQLTYMEVRLLVDDLKLMPKDPPPLPAPKVPAPSAGPATGVGQAAPAPAPAGGDPLLPAASKVSVGVDALPLPGAMVSGTVTFSDGQTGKWYIDDAGQLGVAPTIKGYRPPQSDMAAFQKALQVELQKLGFG